MLTSVNRLLKRLEVDKSTIYSSRVNTNRNINKPSQVVGVSVHEAIYTYEHCSDGELVILVHSLSTEFKWSLYSGRFPSEFYMNTF